MLVWEVRVMSLESAHKGYEYQDLLTAVFLIDELLNSNETKFIILISLSNF